ncbi:MAG: outer membrane protein assembly factor BamE [Pseudomonadota bacterium]|nr:outer membrane protein assembly factor BamE [Pseudomonadota bacterium]
MHKSLPLIFISLLVLGGCSFIPYIPGVTPYQMDIQQGNIYSAAKVASLRPGMSKAKVTLIFGVPLIKDPFHPNRWDYVYTMRHNGKVIDRRHIALFFKHGQLVNIDDGNPADAAHFKARTPEHPSSASEPASPPAPTPAPAMLMPKTGSTTPSPNPAGALNPDNKDKTKTQPNPATSPMNSMGTSPAGALLP